MVVGVRSSSQFNWACPRLGPTTDGMACRHETRELERRLRGHVDTLGPALIAELPYELMLPDRARRLDRRVPGYPETRTFAELLIDCKEDRTLRTVLVGAA
jgi:hypothetical protein